MTERMVKVVGHWDYLDGIQAYFVSKPTEFDETYAIVPASLLKRLEDAEAELHAAGVAMAAAVSAAPHRRNPKYVQPTEG